MTGRRRGKNKCSHCAGKRGRWADLPSATDIFATRLAWMPCQYCSLASFGLDAVAEAEVAAELAQQKPAP